MCHIAKPNSTIWILFKMLHVLFVLTIRTLGHVPENIYEL